MRRKRSEEVLMACIPGAGMFVFMYQSMAAGIIISLAGVLVFILKKYYTWAVICGIFLIIISCWMHILPDSPEPPFFFPFLFVLAILLEDSCYIFRIKRRLKQMLKEMGMETATFDVLPFKVRKYKKIQTNFERPVMVEIREGSKITRAYFDLKADEIVIEEPILFPIYTGTPERKWKEVVRIHKDKTPKRIEFRDKFGNLVGVYVYDETGSKTAESWQLKRSLCETWNREKERWDQKPRGWNP
jgi:hypothetical protein